MLGLAGAAAVATGITVASGGIASADDSIPDGLKPGGELDRYVKKLAAEDQFSGSFLLTHKRRKVLARSYGMADIEREIPHRSSTRYKLASVTKMLTATAVHKLAQQGKLEYGRPIGEYIDGFPSEVAEKVTIHHLLLHTSGLGDFHDLPGYKEASREWDSAAEVFDGTLDFIRKDELDFAPGAGSQYSNAGYCVLGGIIAAVSNQSYYDYMRRHVFEAADMDASDFYTKPQWRDDPRFAHPYFKDKETGEWVDKTDDQVYIELPAGGSFATCADMDRYAHALLDNELLSSPFTRIMLTPKQPMGGKQKPSGGKAQPPRTEFAGYGCSTGLVSGQWVHGFSGGTSPVPSTSIRIYPDIDWVSVILTNHDVGKVEEVNQLMQKLILGDR